MGLFWAQMALGEKATTEYYDSNATVFNLVTTRHLPDTLRNHPDTPRHHSDTPRHHPDTPRHRCFYALEVYWKSNSISECYDQIWFFWIASIPDSIQSHPHALQTLSRHPPDTSQTPQNLALFGCGRKGNSLIWRLLFNCLWFIWHIYSPRHLLDTPRYDPDTVGDPQTPSRHSPDRQRRFYVLEGTGRKGNIWVGMTFIHFYQQIWY